MMRKIKLKDEIYSADVLFIFNCPSSKATKWINSKYHTNENWNDAYGIFYKTPTKVPEYVIWVENWSGKLKDIPMITHEVFHLVLEVLSERGLHLTEDSEEAYSYYFQYIMDQIIKVK